MPSFWKLFDEYTLKARVFPALIATAPLILVIAFAVPWDRLSWTQGLAAVAVPILLWVAADIARQLGQALEERLFAKWGGKPSTVMLRHSEQSPLVDAATRDHHLPFLGKKIAARPPTREEELANPSAADIFYGRCGNWLRENTRDKKIFRLLFEENVTYGYRRNLYALKPISLSVDCLLIVLTAVYFYYAQPAFGSDPALKVLAVVAFSMLHLLFFISLVKEPPIREAAEGYARQLFLCCETLNKPRVRNK